MLDFVILGWGKELHKQDIKFSSHKGKCADYIIIIFLKFLSGNNKHKTNQIKRQDIHWKKDVQDTSPTIQRLCTKLRTDSGKKQLRYRNHRGNTKGKRICGEIVNLLKNKNLKYNMFLLILCK